MLERVLSVPAKARLAQVTRVSPRLLEQSELFAGLLPDDSERVAARMILRDFAPRETIVREGTPGATMFLIADGQVEVWRRDAASGVDFPLPVMGPGQTFGEMSLLTGKPRRATVIALLPTVCAVLDRNDLDDLLARHPSVALALAKVLADRVEKAGPHIGLEFISLAKMRIDPRTQGLLPHHLMLQHRIVPVALTNNRLTLAMTNPNDVLAIDDVRRVLGAVMVKPVIIADDDFRRFMSTTYVEAIEGKGRTESRGAARFDTRGPIRAVPVPHRSDTSIDLLHSEISRDLELLEAAEETTVESKQDLMSASEDAPIKRLANSILGLAIKQAASDIHIEPMEKDVIVRLRLDGVLQIVQRLPKKIQAGLISRLKIISRLDIAERRLPQDGRISALMDGRPIDFRVSTLPGKWGEKVCVRILDKSNIVLGLDRLITHPPTLELLRELINQPHGVLYVTGPTGSGKTTTLYSALSEINEPGVNISTVEDPIEYDLPGINQVQVKPDIGLAFASVLRALLRQDPDVILVGETRDRETAQIAAEAALTGHVVFTTLHTSSAAAAFIRLTEMGIRPFLVSSSTIGVVAQRLVRRLCEFCKEACVVDDGTCEYLGLQRGSTLYRRAGCAVCDGKGVTGRVGIYEVMKINPQIRTLIAKRALADDIHACAVAHGMCDLKRYAGILLLQGLTSVEEVLQIVSSPE